jgi:very-short-patch-repair endonuclease
MSSGNRKPRTELQRETARQLMTKLARGPRSEQWRRHTSEALTGTHKDSSAYLRFYDGEGQRALVRLLDEFPEVIEQKVFGPFRVDAYLPAPYHMAFEADGDRHNPVYDAARDQFLLSVFALPVVRLTNSEVLQEWGRKHQSSEQRRNRRDTGTRSGSR